MKANDTKIQFFNNPQFGEIRIMMTDNDEPLFCLADVCKAVGLTNPRSVKARLDKEDVQLIDLHAVNLTDATVGNTMANFVTEPGFYDVVLQSSSPKMRPFRKWVTSEVLPNGTTKTVSTTVVTGKGQIYFINKFINR